MNQKRVGGYASSVAPWDLYGGANVYGYDNQAVGDNILISLDSLIAGKKAKVRLTGLITNVPLTNLNIGSLSFSPASSVNTNGFVFLELEFFSIGYLLPGALAPGTFSAFYVGKFIGGDGVVQEVSGSISINPFPSTPNLSLRLGVTGSGVSGFNQAFFVLGDYSLEEE